MNIQFAAMGEATSLWGWWGVDGEGGDVEVNNSRNVSFIFAEDESI